VNAFLADVFRFEFSHSVTLTGDHVVVCTLAYMINELMSTNVYAQKSTYDCELSMLTFGHSSEAVLLCTAISWRASTPPSFYPQYNTTAAFV